MKTEDIDNKMDELSRKNKESMSSILELRHRMDKQDYLLKSMRNYASILIVVVGSIVAFFGYNKYNNLKSEITLSYRNEVESTFEGYKKKFDDFVSNYGPRELGRSIASAEVHYALKDYLISFDDKNSIDDRVNQMEKINRICDPDKVSYGSLKDIIAENQASFLGVMPILLHDLSIHDEFKKKGHIALWLIYKVVNHSNGKLNHELVKFLEGSVDNAGYRGSRIGYILVELAKKYKSENRIQKITNPALKISKNEKLKFLISELSNSNIILIN